MSACASAPAAGTGHSPSPSASASAAATTPLVVISETDPTAGGQHVLHLVRLDGSQEGTLTVKDGAALLVARGSRVFVREGSELKALDTDGSVEDLGNLQTETISGPFVPSPDGNQWLWGTLSADGKSVVYLGSSGQQARVMDEMTSPTVPIAVYAYSWTFRGPFIEHGKVGIGGYILFHGATGPVFQLEPVSAKETPVPHTDQCAFSDWSYQGIVACFNPQAAPPGLTLYYPNGTSRLIALDAQRFSQAGDAFFSDNDQHLIVGGAVHDPRQERYDTAIVNPANGAIAQVAVDGARPAVGPDSIRPDGTFIVWRPYGTSVPSPGVFVVSTGGKATTIFGKGWPIGLLLGASAGSDGL